MLALKSAVCALALLLSSLPSRAAAQTCTGDCDGDGAVTVNEIVTALNIALGSRPLADCPAGDAGDDGSITVDEIVAALNFALTGCPANTPQITATATATPTATASPSPTTDPGNAVRIDIDSGSGLPGAVVRVSITMSDSNNEVAAISNDITYDTTHIRVVQNEDGWCQINPEIGPDSPLAKMLISNILPAEGSLETIRIGVFGLNSLPIPDGLAYTCDFRIGPAAPAGSVVLENQPDASDAAGNRIPSVGTDGLVTIR